MTDLRAAFGLSEEQSIGFAALVVACIVLMAVCSAIDGKIARNREARRWLEEQDRREAIKKGRTVPVGPDPNLIVPTDEEKAELAALVALAERIATRTEERKAHEADPLDAGGSRL